MIRYLLSLVCRWRGHRFAKPFANDWHWTGAVIYAKRCHRCGLIRAVKRRQPKVIGSVLPPASSRLSERLTEALQANPSALDPKGFIHK